MTDKTVKANLAVGFGARPGSTYLGESWSDAEHVELTMAIIDQIRERVSKAWQATWDDLTMTVDENGHLPESDVRDFVLAELTRFNADAANAVCLSLTGGNGAASAGVHYIIVNGVRICIHNYLLSWVSRGGSGAPQPWVFNRFVGTPKEFSTHLFIQLSWATPVS